MLISTQEMCTVCAKRTIGSEIIFCAPMVLLGDVGHVDSLFGPFRDAVSVDARYVHGWRQSTIGSSIVLDAPDGTHR